MIGRFDGNVNAENHPYVELRNAIAVAWTGAPYGPGNSNSCDAIMEIVWPLLKQRDDLIHHYEVICARYALTLKSVSEDLTANIVHQPPLDTVQAGLEEMLAEATTLVRAVVAVREGPDRHGLAVDAFTRLRKLQKKAKAAHANDIEARVKTQAKRLLTEVFQVDDEAIETAMKWQFHDG